MAGKANEGNWFERGHSAWDKGSMRSAFRLFLEGAKHGDVSCQQNVGYFYDEGIGIRENIEKAIHWYQKSARSRSSSAAFNLGLIYRRQGTHWLAKKWFEKALELGETDALSELANLRRTASRIAKKSSRRPRPAIPDRRGRRER